MDQSSLIGAFTDAPQDAARAFRGVMNAMARPGTIETLSGATPPAPMSAGAGALALTLLDTTTPVYLCGDMDCPAVRDWLTFHTGAPFVGPATCAFAFGTWDALLPLNAYPIGTSEYPDRSTTLIVEMPELAQSGTTLRGPGIKDSAALNLPDLTAFQNNAVLFPQGLDFFFTAGAQVAALPRSTKVEAA